MDRVTKGFQGVEDLFSFIFVYRVQHPDQLEDNRYGYQELLFLSLRV